MNAITAEFAATQSRPTPSKLVIALRALADRFEAKSLEKTKAKQRAIGVREIHRLVDNYEAIQPNLAAELRFLASRD